MTTKVWGPPIWTLFHVLAEKIHQDKFPALKNALIHHIKSICYNLPCPTCAAHAKAFLLKINFAMINDKTTLQNFLHNFHNTVNKRKSLPIFDKSKLVGYKNVNLTGAFNNFLLAFNTKGNMTLLADSFQRSIILKNLKTWLHANSSCFDA